MHARMANAFYSFHSHLFCIVHCSQVTACAWVMSAATLLQLLCKPYQHRTEELLETLSLGGTTIVMMIGQLIFQAGGADGLGAKGLAACQGTAIAILLFTVCCFCAFFIGALLAAWRKKKDDVVQPASGIALPATEQRGARTLSGAEKARLKELYNAAPASNPVAPGNSQEHGWSGFSEPGSVVPTVHNPMSQDARA